MRTRFIHAALGLALLTLAATTVQAQTAVNSASVAPPAGVADPVSGNNSATDSDSITRSSNLSLSLADSPDPVNVGNLLTYTLSVSNGGASAILSTGTLSIVASLPAGLSGCTYTPSAGTFNVGTIAPGATGTGTWSNLAIASGGNASLAISCTVTAAAAASISHSATAIPPTGTADPDCSGAPVSCAGGNTATATTTVNRPQLTLTKTASASPFTVGVPASFTLQLSNTGTAATTASATITDTIPAGLTIGTLPAGCSAAGQTVTCVVAAGVAAGGSSSFVIPVTPSLAAGSSITNTATASGGGDSTCPGAARCSSSVTVAVNRPELTLTKTASASPFTVGVPASFTLQLSNTGTAATTASATITDPIPGGLTIGTLPAGCSAAGQTVTCVVAAGVAAGGSSAFVIPVTPTVTAASSITNTATVSGGGDSTCPAAARCSSSVTVAVNRPELTLTKTASASPFTVGVPASFTLQLSNTGTAATTASATITDTIPAGLTIGTLPAGCSAAGQTVTCVVAAGVAAGGSSAFVIPVTPTVTAASSITNTATVSGGGDSTCPADARCSGSVTVAVNGTCATLSFPYTLPDNAPATLRQAITCANANGTADEINLNGQTVTLTDSVGNFSGATGLPQVTTPISVRNGTITRSGAVEFRFFSVSNTGNLTLRDLTLTNGGGASYAANGGSISTLGTSSTLNVVNTTISGSRNAPLQNGNAIYTNANFALVNSSVIGGSSGRGAVASANGPVLIQNSQISGNVGPSTVNGAGGVYLINVASATIVNSTIVGNYCASTVATQSGGIYADTGAVNLTIRNSIVWGNRNSGNTAPQIVNASAGTTTVSNSLIEGGFPGGTNILSGDPLFVVPITASATPTTAGNFQLADLSPAIDAGANADVPLDALDVDADSNTTEEAPDRAGAPRRVNDTVVPDTGTGTAPLVDLGAYERQTDSIPPDADVSISKSNGVSSLIPGTSVTYTLVASNAGPGPAGTVTVSDTFPATLTAITWTVTAAGGASCGSNGSGSISSVVSLPVSGSCTYTANATVSPGATGTLSNTASVTVGGGSTDPVPGNNSATDTDTLTPQADVSISKTDGQTSDTAGTSIQYTITAQNLGPSHAPSVSVADTLPAALTGATWSVVATGGASCGSGGSGDISQSISLPVGGSCVFTVNATIDNAASGTLSNTATATVAGGVTDPVPGNNSATDTTTIIPLPTASISVSPTSVIENGVPNLSYTVTLSSPAPSALSVNYTVSGSATDGVDYASLSSPLIINSGASNGTIVVDPTGDSTIEPDETVTLTLASGSGYLVGAPASATGTISNDDLPTLSVSDVTVTEGDSGTVLANFTVSLSQAALAGGVSFDIATADGSATAGGDYVAQSLSGQSIPEGSSSYTFSVVVNGDTLNETNETYFVNVTGVNGATVNDAQGLGTISNDDPLPTLSIADLSVIEGNGGSSTAVFTVSLNTASGRSVGVNYATADATANSASDYAATSGSLLFSPGTTSRTISVTVTGDFQVEADETFNLNLSSPSNATIADAQGVGTIQNDDTASISLIESAGSTAVTEGGATDSYTLVLSSQPSANVAIALAGNQVTPSPTPIVFTSANWNTPQTVTVTAIDDAVAEATPHAGSVTAVVTSSDSNYNGRGVPTISVAVTDNDTAGITVSPTAGLITTEAGGTASFTVVLNTQPTATVAIGVSSSNASEGSVAPPTLTFTPANWNTPQTVTVTGVDDLIDDGDVAYSIVTAPASSGDPSYDGLNAADVALSNSDDDNAGITVSPTAGLITTEAGGTASFTVVLATQPTANVAIGLSSSNASEGTAAPPALTFTPANWSTPQSVTVTGVDDVIIDGSVAYSIVTAAATSSDPNYSGLDAANVAVSNSDNDVASVVISESGGTTAVTEGGATDSYTLVLSSQPTANVSIALSGSQVTASPTSIVFTSANWNAPQTATVTAVDDTVDEATPHAGSVSAVVTSSDSNYNVLSVPTISVAVTDNDTAGISVNPTVGLSTSEAGGTASFTVELNTQPTANVAIGLSSSDASEGSVAPMTLTFTPANWDTPQTVTVTGVDDPIDDGDIAYSIVTAAATSSDPNYSGLNASDVSLSNTDNDSAGITVTPTAGLITTEAGGSAGFTVVLNTQPTANVAIGLSSSDASEGTAAPMTLTFTPANWDTPQAVTVTGADDPIDDGDMAYSIVTAAATSSDPSYSGVDAADVSLSNTDNDSAAITLVQSGGTTTVTEGGATDSYTLVLTSQPSADVSIALTGTQVTPSPTPVVFTSANWNTPQTVTVSAIDDAIAEGAHSGSISSLVTSGDTGYNGQSIASLSVAITDNDNAAISLVQSGGTTAVAEGGATDSYTLVLTSQPSADVSIALTGTQVTTSPTTVVFTSANWNTPQTVTVTAIDDAIAEGAHAGSISSLVTSSDTGYNGAALASLSVAITDNDNAAISLVQSGGNTAVTEGGATDSYTLVLTSQPTADVSIALAGTQVTTSSTTIVFTPATWNVAQTVTVTAIDDAIAEGAHSGSITSMVTSSDTGYNGTALASLSVAITDNDNVGITLVQSGGNTAVTEGGSTDSYTLVLTSQPSANVSIALTGTQVTPSSTPVVFTSANWNTPQTVTVTAIDDAVVEGAHSGSISAVVSSSDTSYHGFALASLSVAITDNDVPGVSVVQSGGNTAVAEGGASDSLTVVLQSQPTSDVTITLTGSQITPSPTPLNFTSANWNAPQTVTVTAIDDAIDEASPHAGQLSFAVASSDPNYQGSSVASVAIDVADNDTAGITLVESAGSTAATEGGATDSYTLVLSSQPTANVAIALSVGTQAQVSPGTVSFTAANWNTPQTVTVNAVDDSVVEGPHAATISHGVSSSDPNYSGFVLPAINVAITDNDSAVVNFSAANVSQSEGAGPMAYTVTLSNPVQSGVTLTLNSTNGSAGAADYTPISGATVSFAANSNTSQTVNVIINNDALDEDDETYSLTLSNLVATGNVTLGTATANATILDDDATPTISISSPSQNEGNSGSAPMNFTVSLSAVSGRAVSFSAATANGTATAPSDYLALTATPQTIPAGQSSLTLPVTINGDASFEGDESFSLQLTGISNATPATLTGTGTILEDDQQPTTTVISSDLPDPSVVGQSYPVAVTVTAQSSSPTGTVSVSDGSASCTITLVAATVPTSTGSCNLTSTTAGAKTLTASYTASSTNFGNSSGTTTHQVNPAATTISVSGPARSRVNQPTAFSFALAVTSPGAGTPSGTVTLSSGASSCIATLPATSCNLTFTALGNRTVSVSYAGDGNYASSSSSGAGNTQTLVYALSDLAVTKTDIVTTFEPDDLLVYTVTVRNLGPDTAEQIRILDNVPAGLNNVTWSCDASGGVACPVPGGSGNLDLTIASFPMGGLLNFTFYGNAAGATVITNTALVELPADTTVEDPELGNNSATDVNVYEPNFRDGFEDPQVNAATGSVRLPASTLRSLLDANARVVYTLRDARGTALRLYARVHNDRSQYALALRTTQGPLRLGAWQTLEGDPQLSWTAASDVDGWVLGGASLR